MPTKTTQLSEGKSKILFETDDPDLLICHYKDATTAFNGVKKGVIEDKGVFNCGISTNLFKLIEANGIQTHLVQTINEREQLVRRIRIVPVEFVVRNVAAGSFSKRYGVEEGSSLPGPLPEFFVKSDELGDPLIGREAIYALGLADEATLNLGVEYSLKVNALLKDLFASVGITLVDFKLEFGFNADGEFVLGDEITPDGCRLWDAETNEKLDKDRFRRDLGKVEEAYAKVARLVAEATA